MNGEPQGQSAEVTVSIDGTDVSVPDGASLLDACRAAGVAIPTVCYGETLTPANACRACVVEVDGARVLAPSCSRRVEEAMVISTDSERVRHSRRMVFELLATDADLSQAPELAGWCDEYGADPDRYHAWIDAADIVRMDEEPRVQDRLFVRDYDRCVLCYKCVEACGDDAQHTFAIALAGRGHDARVSTEFDVELPQSACVYCGNCVAVCPTNALQFHTEFEMRASGDWRPDDQAVTTTVCSYCGVGCNLELHVQDNRIVKVTSPDDHEVTSGNLCIKGRFGWTYV